VGFALYVGDHSNAVKGYARDVELEWNADEGGHGVVEKDVGRKREANVSRVLDVSYYLEVFGTPFTLCGMNARQRW